MELDARDFYKDIEGSLPEKARPIVKETLERYARAARAAMDAATARQLTEKIAKLRYKMSEERKARIELEEAMKKPKVDPMRERKAKAPNRP
jgi:hypothetical protein